MLYRFHKFPHDTWNIGLGNIISILLPDIMTCNTKYCSYFENAAIPFVHYYYIFCTNCEVKNHIGYAKLLALYD